MSLIPQSLPIPQIRETQAPSALSRFFCPENAEKASEAESEWLRCPYPTTRNPWCKSNRVPLCQATLSIGLYLLLEGPVPTRMLYPARRKINLQITHTPTARAREVARSQRIGPLGVRASVRPSELHHDGVLGRSADKLFNMGPGTF